MSRGKPFLRSQNKEARQFFGQGTQAKRTAAEKAAKSNKPAYEPKLVRRNGELGTSQQ